LAKFYRSSTDTGGEWIPVGKEKVQIENYLHIQSLRHSDRLQISIRFDDDVLDKWMIKFLLQPLVENAIHHGIDKKEGLGCISITAVLQGKDLVFQVIDNGVGISQERLEEVSGIIEAPSSVEKEFYALHNVNMRVKLHYGQSYGLALQSTLGSGTCVTLRMPSKEGAQLENIR
jgi:two-component system sensor histidine kinase YesM